MLVQDIFVWSDVFETSREWRARMASSIFSKIRIWGGKSLKVLNIRMMVNWTIKIEHDRN